MLRKSYKELKLMLEDELAGKANAQAVFFNIGNARERIPNGRRRTKN